MSALVAVVEDDHAVRGLLTHALDTAGFRTQAFGRAGEFEAAMARIKPDVCLVDLGLPDQDGLALVWRIARESGAAIIIISGRTQVQDRIAGLELGADDYITKPFDPAEVVTRVRVLLRRRERDATETDKVCFSGWTVDFQTLVLTDGAESSTTLSQAEAQILRIFLRNPNRILSRSQLQTLLGQDGYDGFDRAMDVRISRLRAKLRDDPKSPTLIKTIYGAGYIFVASIEHA